MTSRIQPRTLNGFRDYLPATMMVREHLIRTACAVYRSYGFSPIDTPALEYSEILLGKGGEETNKQLYRFTRGKRDIAMRFDLTVPLARFVAQHAHELAFPFKRYHVGPVWRGERPQKGRYREFVQCDFDTVGTESNLADIETLFVIHDLMEALGFSAFTIRVNNRLVLNGLLETLGLAERSVDVLRALDKLEKFGREAVRKELIEHAEAAPEQADRILEVAGTSGSTENVLERLGGMLAANPHGSEGVARLRELFEACATAGIPSDRVALDVSIARGLDYYTGTIYETFLDELPSLGSVCSGGRYDNLVETFSKQHLPGVGSSLGLDRLLSGMEELGMLPTVSTPAHVLVTRFSADRGADYLRIARILRAGGVAAEVFPDALKIGKQLKFADQKGFHFAVIAGDNEFAAGCWQVKDLKSGEQVAVSEERLVSQLQERLESEQ